MVNNPGIATKLFEVLNENNIEIYLISTSEIKISIVVKKENANLATKVIHNKFFKTDTL